MDVFENSKAWKEEAKIDYFAPFIKLWVAFNSWYEKNFIKASQNKKIGDNLKNFDVNILQLLIDNDFLELDQRGKLIIKKERVLVRGNFLEDIEFLLKEKASEVWEILLNDRLKDNEFIKRITESADLEGLFMSRCESEPDFKINLFELRNLSKELLNERKINISEENEKEIYAFYWSITDLFSFDNSLNEKGVVGIEANEQNKIFEGKDEKEISSNRVVVAKVEYYIFPEIYKNFLCFAYFIRNKIIHGEFSPKNERHEKIAKYTFFVLKSFIEQFIK